jgi:hypothetical protein
MLEVTALFNRAAAQPQAVEAVAACKRHSLTVAET